MTSEKLDLSLLNFARENLHDINNIFNNLVKEISNKLNLSVVYSNISVKYIEDQKNIIITKDNIFDLGVSRLIKENNLDILIYNNFKEYLPIILLREAYLCFVPHNLINEFEIGLLIELISESYLNEYKRISDWKNLIRNYIVDYEFISTEIYHFEKFFKIEMEDTMLERVKFIFEFIRNNSKIIADGKENIHEIIIKEYVLQASQLIRDDDIVETLRILIFIFYKVKNYKALMDYQGYFKQFQEEGLLKTELSLKKFSENVKWINKYSYVAPSYQITWSILNLRVVYYSLIFHPYLEKVKIIQIIKNLKFNFGSYSCPNNFGFCVNGWIVCPEEYLKDILKFFNRLEEDGYIIKKRLFHSYFCENFINLNYFRAFYRQGTLINTNHNKYDNKYEISFFNDYTPDKFKSVLNSLNILDISILNRVTHWSIDGLGFERKSETLKNVKTDVIYQILMVKNSITKLKQNLNLIQKDSILKNKFVEIVKNNIKFGFFYFIEYLSNLLKFVNNIKVLLIKDSSVKNQYDAYNVIEKKKLISNLETNLFFNKNEYKKTILKELIPLYFQNYELFLKEIHSYKIFLNLLESCLNLKIYNLNSILKIIQEEEIADNIYSMKKDKLIQMQKEYKLKKIIFNEIEKRIEKFCDPQSPLLAPILINTINTTNFAKYNLQMILNENPDVIEKLKQIKPIFPRISINRVLTYLKENKEIIISILLPNLKIKEKNLFISLLWNLFKKDIIELKRYFFDGFYHSLEIKEFFDLQKQEFFYTKDLIEQYYLYVQKTLGPPLKPLIEIGTQNQELFFSPNVTMIYLLKQIEHRKNKEYIEYNVNLLNSVIDFQKNIKSNILNKDKFYLAKKQDFFKKYIKSIQLAPVYNKFGFSQYYLYIRPRVLEKIDFRLLLINNFQKLYYSANIDENRSFFIKYIFPYRSPNDSYINWIRSKRLISEYCLFFVKKIIMILNFDHNLNKMGWKINAKEFKEYLEKKLLVLNLEIRSEIDSYDVGEHRYDQVFGLDSSQFKNLIEVFSENNVNVNSIFGPKRFYELESKIINLTKENLIIPYIKLKNLGFIEKIYFILPNVKKELINQLIEIFNFFNYGFIYEIEGEYFVIDYHNQEKFENGLMIELYLPNIELNEFFELFAKLFSYLDIKHYIILYDLINGELFLKTVFKDINIDKYKSHYNPLKTLKWNKIDKIWMNHKLFTEKFEPIYPDL